MDYLIKQEDMMDLKVEDNSDQYLFNSLLDIGHHNQPYRTEEEAQPYSFFDREYHPI